MLVSLGELAYQRREILRVVSYDETLLSQRDLDQILILRTSQCHVRVGCAHVMTVGDQSKTDNGARNVFIEKYANQRFRT